METDLDRIRQLAKEKEDENWEFRTFLKWCDIPDEEIDSIVHRLYQEARSKIDCRTCANCCKEMSPSVNREDMEVLSKSLGVSVSYIKKQYLLKHEVSAVFVFNRRPCPFLKNNVCSLGTHRPRDCISYPHLHKGDFTTRLINVIENYSVCSMFTNV